MADKKLSEADERTELDGTEEFSVIAGGENYRVPVAALSLYLATAVEAVTTTTYTVLQADHNKIKDFTHVSGCTVTVPDGLTSGIAGVPFTGGLSKGDGAGDVTVVAGVGGAVEAPGGRLVMGDEFGLMTLTEWPDGSFRLYGGTA